MYELTEGSFWSPHGHPMRMVYRQDTNDFNTIRSSTDGDEYKLPTGLVDQVYDIGGYLGSVGIALALDNPDCYVTIIEPVPPNAALIRRNIEFNGVGDRVTLMEGAVGGPDDTVSVWYGYKGSESLEHHAFVGNSTLAYDYGGDAEHDEVTYDAISLVDLVDTYGPIDFMKIDTEGAEWAFLQGPLASVREIVGEWHPVRGHTLGDMAARLGPTHVVTFDGPQAGPGGFRAVRR